MIKTILDTYPGVRWWVYVVFALIGLALGGTQVGYAAADAGQPTWLTVALAVFGFLGTAVGFTAASKVPTTRTTTAYVGEHRDQAGQSGVHLALVIVAAVVAAWIVIEVLQLLLRG